MITLGAIAIAFGLIRILAFKIPESPRYLLSKGRDADAVEAVNYIARFNSKPETLTLAMLEEIDAQFTQSPGGQHPATTTSSKGLSQMQILKESFKDYDTGSFKRLFSGRLMARHSSVTFLIWLTIGIAYPLYFAFITSYLETKSTYSANSSLSHTYMVYCIVSAVGVLGPVAAGFCVETRLGRRWMMALSAILTGVFLFLYTLAKTEAADIGFQCATGILGNFGASFTGSLPHAVCYLANSIAPQNMQSCSHSRPSRSQVRSEALAQESRRRCLDLAVLLQALSLRTVVTLPCLYMLVRRCGLSQGCSALRYRMRRMATPRFKCMGAGTGSTGSSDGLAVARALCAESMHCFILSNSSKLKML